MWLSRVYVRAWVPGRLLPRDPVVYCASYKSNYTPLPEDSNCKMELAMSSDGRAIVCYHPSFEVPYEYTRPIQRRDYNIEDTQEQILKARFDLEITEKQGPLFEKLSKMFYTTKHRWYPVGLYHRRRMKSNPPKER